MRVGGLGYEDLGNWTGVWRLCNGELCFGVREMGYRGSVAGWLAWRLRNGHLELGYGERGCGNRKLGMGVSLTGVCISFA